MPLNTIPLPFGMRDIKVTGYTTTAATTLNGSSVDFPNARTLQFDETEDFTDLRGDDATQATHGSGNNVEWQLEGGGYSFEAVQIMYGGTVSTSGTTPNQIKTYKKLATDVRPYFKAEGQSISDSGGDFHTIIWRCKAKGNLTGEMADAQFWLTGAQGVGLPSLISTSLGETYEFVQNETAVAIP